MTEKSPLQITTQTSGNPSKNITLSADSAEEMNALVAELVKNADEIIEGLTNLDQVLLAKGVMSGAIGGDTTGTTVSSGRVSVTRTPPPVGDRPTCPTNGPMKDMAGKTTKAGQPYKFRWYCTKFRCEDCEPQGEWVA